MKHLKLMAKIRERRKVMLYIIKPKIKGRIHIGPNIDNTGESHRMVITDVPEKMQQRFIKELEEKEAELKKLTDKMSEKELDMETKKKKVEDNTDEKYEISNAISTLKANVENSNSREKVVEEEIDVNISELDSSRMQKSEISQKFAEIEAKREKIKSDLNKIDEKRKESDVKLKEYDLKINQCESEIRMKDSRMKFLIETEKEKEGYIRSVKSILQDCEKDLSLKKGVHGVIANLISVPKEYETAIEMCLGQCMQNIVTDTEEDAKKLVEHLRKFNLILSNFFPLTELIGKKLALPKLNFLK